MREVISHQRRLSLEVTDSRTEARGRRPRLFPPQFEDLDEQVFLAVEVSGEGCWRHANLERNLSQRAREVSVGREHFTGLRQNLLASSDAIPIRPSRTSRRAHTSPSCSLRTEPCLIVITPIHLGFTEDCGIAVLRSMPRSKCAP